MAKATDNSKSSDDSGPRGLMALLRSPAALGRAVRAGGWRSVMIGGGVVAALAILSGAMLYSRPAVPGRSDYRAALAAVDAGDFETARARAAELYRQPLEFEQSGAPYYVLGAAAMQESQTLLDVRRRNETLVLAARYLEAARELGFPPGREADGALRLASCLYDSGQFARCLPVLKQLVNSTTEPLAEAQRMLAGAYLRDSDPHFPQALAHIQRYLAIETLTDEQRRAGQLEQTRILLELKRLDDARDVLAGLSSAEGGADVALLEGRLALAEALAAAPVDGQQLRAAMQLLQRAIDRDVADTDVTPQAEYLLALAHSHEGDEEVTLKHLARLSRRFETRAEGWSASLLQGELLLAAGDDEAALVALQEAAQGASATPVYANPWISRSDFRRRLREAFAVLLSRGKYGLANHLAAALPPLISLADSVQMRSDAYQQWGEALQRQAAAASPSQKPAIHAEAQQRHRRAAHLLAWLADLRYATSHYPEDIWRSGQQYMAGHDFENATEMFEIYLDAELRERRPETLTSLARAQLSLGNLDAAWNAISEVLADFPQHPETYQARLLGSEIWLERRQVGQADALAHLAEAQRLLEANLHEEALTPRSREWRDSLFALGHVLSLRGLALETLSRQQGVDVRDDPEATKAGLRELERSHEAYQAAIARLEEAVRRYPEAPQATLATYELAEAHRNSAKLPRKKLPLVQIQTTRVQLQRQMQEQLSSAYEVYRQLQQRLNQQQERTELTAVEQAILRNCYFARADALFDQGRFEEAIREYSTASNRYQHEPAALEAFVQIASCYRLLGRPYEARGTLEQAKVVLARIRDDADFTATSRSGRGEWQQLLDLLSTL